MLDFESMLDELLDAHPEAKHEIEALRSKVAGEALEAKGEALEHEGEDTAMADEGAPKFRPVPPELEDDEEGEADEDEEEAY